MKPRNTTSPPRISGGIACAYPMRKISLQRYALPEPETGSEAAYRADRGDMLRRELLAFADTMQRTSNPKRRELLATRAAELLAYAWAKDAKTYERVGRETIKRIVAKQQAEIEAEYLKEAGYALN